MTTKEARIAELQNEITKIFREINEICIQDEKILSPSLPKMIQIPGRSYSVSETPITIGQYKDFLLKELKTDQGRQWLLEFDEEPANLPTTKVSWRDAVAYCNWLSKKEGKTYRLLTEDEWEHCCGNHQNATDKIAVFNAATCPHVASKEPNDYGLYDMLGLVWEWTSSLYVIGRESRVVRGGSWHNLRGRARADYRNYYHPDSRNDYNGFRVLCESSQS